MCLGWWRRALVCVYVCVCAALPSHACLLGVWGRKPRGSEDRGRVEKKEEGLSASDRFSVDSCEDFMTVGMSPTRESEKVMLQTADE